MTPESRAELKQILEEYWPLDDQTFASIEKIMIRERIEALTEAKRIVLKRTEIPADAKNPTRDQTVIIGEVCADAIDYHISEVQSKLEGEKHGNSN